MSAFKYLTIECPHMPTCTVLQLSRENKCEGLLPDCKVGVKESESKIDQRWMCLAAHMKTYFLIKLWYDRMTRQAASDGEQNVWWWGLLQVSAWHDRSYIAGIPLLARGLTMKLSPCPCSHNSLAGRIAECQHVWSTTCGHLKCDMLPAQVRPRMMQHLSSKITHWIPKVAHKLLSS